MDLFEQLSEERKLLQEQGELPEWYTTHGYQLFKDKYQYKGQTVRQTFKRIADCAAKHTDNVEYFSKKFFELMWKGWLAPSTPVMANMGTDRGCPVSCSGQYVGDSISDFYEGMHESAMLSKNGFGTSGYLGDIRPRGSVISKGGKASGVTPVLNGFVQVARDVSQGSSRRGAFASYLDIEHQDFYEVVEGLIAKPDDKNIGWNITDSFIEKLQSGDKDSITRYQKAMKAKCLTGKGYFFFVDKVNRANPPMYEHHDVKVYASNLCTEITLYANLLESFTCVLSSLNISKWDEYKDTNTIFLATIFLDCVASEFIEMGSKIKGLEKAVRFTERNRALGLGALGFHTYLQQKSVVWGSFESMMINRDIFQTLQQESLKASKWMAENWGEPEMCKGYGVRNTHTLAVAPNTSSALLCGGVSQGVEPIVENVYNQSTAAGEMQRINPVFLDLAQREGKYSKSLLQDIIDNNGSVQHLEWLSQHDKDVFKTAFEIDQMSIIRMASQRQQFIDQAQSINLFFNADEDEEYISEVHKEAFLDPNIKSLYYMRTKAGVQAAKGECLACEG